MGGSCDGDCNSCDPEGFCHQYKYDIDRLKEELKHCKHSNKTLRRSNSGLKAIVERLKGKLEGQKSLYNMANEYRVELADLIEKVRISLMNEIDHYDSDSMLQTVINTEILLRLEDNPEPDFDNFDTGEAYKQ